MEEIRFSLREQYLFCFAAASNGPTVFTAKPSSISDEGLRFHILDRYKPESVLVTKAGILAVYDNICGTVAIKGYYGKYRILNEKLFNTYIAEKVLELQKI